MTGSAFIVRWPIVALTAVLAISTMAVPWRVNAQPARTAGSLRILLATSHDDAADGAAMGVAEARRTAELLGHTIHATVQRVSAGSSASATVAPLLASGGWDAIAGGDTVDECRAMAALARDARLLYVNAWCDDDGLRAASAPRCEGSHQVLPVLHVAPSRRMRDAAVAASVASPSPDSATVNAAGTASAGARSIRVDASHAIRDRQALAWHPSLERFGAAQVNDRYRLAYKRGMSERAWLGWAAVKLLADVALRPGAASLGAALLESRPLDGHKGRALRVRGSDGQLLQPLYVVAAGTESRADTPILAEIANPVAWDGSAGAARAAKEGRCE